MKNLISSLLCVLLTFLGASQSGKKIVKQNSKDVIHIVYGDSAIYARGLYNDSTRLFIGNSNGSIFFYNIESKKNQLILKLPDVNEIRDIERCDNAFFAMHSGENGKLIRLELNGNVSVISPPEWKGIFFDALDFNGQVGFLMGDPKDSLFSLYHTLDGGESWTKCKGEIKAIKGEAGFAASGTNVQVLNDSTYVFISGGMQSRFFKSTDNGNTWTDVVLPYYPGESTGAYSMCFANDSIGVIVGGDYKDPGLGMNTSFYTFDGGASWYNANQNTRGYRSCVFYHDDVFYASGRNGIDFSIDGGKEWISFANGPYFSLSATKDKLIATTKFGAISLFPLYTSKK